MRLKRAAILLITIIFACCMVTISMSTIGISQSVKKVVGEPENVVVAPAGPEPGPKATVEVDYNTSRPDLSPALREVVVVHFKELPVSVGEYASDYGGRLVFLKEDINFAAFEMSPKVSTPLAESQRTHDFMSMASGDARVEEARLDTFLFVNPNKEYTKEPLITYPADLVKQGVKPENITNRIMVSFWVFPLSLEEFAQKHGGKLMSLDESNKRLLYAVFETDDLEGFLNSVSKDPYIRSARPDSSSIIAC